MAILLNLTSRGKISENPPSLTLCMCEFWGGNPRFWVTKPDKGL
jgi:hypothetical protein